MYRTRKSKKLDLVGQMLIFLFVGICFGGFGFLFLFLAEGIIPLTLFASLFILVFVGFTLAGLKTFFTYFILNRPYEYYVTTFKSITTGRMSTTSSTMTIKRKGSEIGLPDRFKDLTPEQNRMLEDGSFVFEGDLDTMRSMNIGPKYIRRENTENVKTIESKQEPNTSENKKDDPFSKEDCKYNIDKDDPFADFYKKK